MGIRSPESVVPEFLTPAVGNVPALTLSRDDGHPSVVVNDGTIDVDGVVFTLTGKTLSRLAAEISRSLPTVVATAHLDVEPVAGDLLSLEDDTTPSGGRIVRYRGVAARILETTRIRLLPPAPASAGRAWHVRVNRGSFRATVNGASWLFAVPEYDSQPWSPKFGKPYVDVTGAAPEILSPTTLRAPHAGLVYEPGLVVVTARGRRLPDSIVSDVDEANGIVYLSRPIDFTDRITLSYSYREESYVYRGVDLNPTIGHSPDIAERFVLFYLVPHQSNVGVRNSRCVRHVVSHSIEGAVSLLERGVGGSTPVVLLGAARIRQVDRVGDVSVVDTRSQGGGVADGTDPRPIQVESSFYGDVGRLDGDPFPGNAVLVATVPPTVLESFTRDQVTEIVNRHVALGTLTILEIQEQ